MNKLLAEYQHDILIMFISHYKKEITKNVNITFEDVLIATLQDLNINSTSKEETLFLEDWFNQVHYQSFLAEYFNKDFIEIIFHSNHDVQIIDLHSKKTYFNKNLSPEDFQLSLEVLALKNQISWNFKDPFASFGMQINNLSVRMTLVHFSTSANLKSKFFIRLIQKNNPSLDLFKLEPDLLSEIRQIVSGKKNTLISGGTGSGKTTLLRALLGLIPSDEHIIVLEDTHEILNFHPGQTSFLANQDQANKSLKDYCAYSLRMSPDRLIIGEMRSREVVPFLLAMNTGHKGLMSTIHANSGSDALSRISLLFSLFSEGSVLSYSLVTKLVCKNIDYVVHMENKKIKEICKVLGSEGETPFYEILYSA